MQPKKQLLSVIFLFGLFLSGFVTFTSCGKEQPNTIAVTSITLDRNDLTLVVKTSEVLNALVVTEDDATDIAVTWTSSDNGIVEVDATGKIKAKASGQATIAAQAGDKTAYCKVVVPNHDVYITGYQQLTTGLNALNTAQLWKNGDLVNITQPTTKDAVASGFFMSGSNSYVVGYEKKPNVTAAYATLWTNGTPARLSDGNSYATADDVISVNNDVIVVGSDKGMACYWKNGIKTVLYSATSGVANTISQTADGSIYIGGYISEAGKQRAAIWKNGTMTLLGTSGIISSVSRIITAGTDVYARGSIGSKPVIWKNNKELPISYIGSTGVINDISISGSDIYVLGQEVRGEKSIVWKNGVNLNMNFEGGFSVSKIQVVDDIIYVGGYSGVDKIAIFANGKRMEIEPQSNAEQTQIMSMRVIKNS